MLTLAARTHTLPWTRSHTVWPYAGSVAGSAPAAWDSVSQRTGAVIPSGGASSTFLVYPSTPRSRSK